MVYVLRTVPNTSGMLALGQDSPPTGQSYLILSYPYLMPPRNRFSYIYTSHLLPRNRTKSTEPKMLFCPTPGEML